MTSGYGISGVVLPHNFYSSIRKLWKECTSKYVNAYAMEDHSGRQVYEIRPLCKIQTSELRAINWIHTAMGRDSSFAGLRIGLLHFESS